MTPIGHDRAVLGVSESGRGRVPRVSVCGLAPPISHQDMHLILTIVSLLTVPNDSIGLAREFRMTAHLSDIVQPGSLILGIDDNVPTIPFWRGVGNALCCSGQNTGWGRGR
jgi:hypothetical protein